MYEWIKVVHVSGGDFLDGGAVVFAAAVCLSCRMLTVGSAQDETFKVMERRLLKAIMRPAAVVALMTGLGLIWCCRVWFAGYLVGGETVGCCWACLASHGMLESHVVQFARGERLQSSRYFRILNEVPTVLMIVIVIMVIVKPFRLRLCICSESSVMSDLFSLGMSLLSLVVALAFGAGNVSFSKEVY